MGSWTAALVSTLLSWSVLFTATRPFSFLTVCYVGVCALLPLYVLPKARCSLVGRTGLPRTHLLEHPGPQHTHTHTNNTNAQMTTATEISPP